MVRVATTAALLGGVGLLAWWLLFPTLRQTWTVPGASCFLHLSRDGRTLLSVDGGSVSFSGGTSFLLTGPVRLLDVATGRERLRVPAPPARLVWADLCPDGACLAVEDREGSLTVWDATTGEQRAALRTTANVNGGVWWDPRNPRFSPDGRWLAFEREDKQAVLIWETTGRRVCWVLEGCRAPVAFSADGRTLAAGAGDAVARVWDLTTGKERVALRGRVSSLNAVVLSPDGRLVVTASSRLDAGAESGHELRLWRADTGCPVRVLEVGPGYFWYPLNFSPDGRLLLEPEELWDVTTPRPTALSRLSLQRGIPGSCWARTNPDRPAPVLSPDGRWLALPAEKEGSLRVLDTATLATQAVLDLNDGSEDYLEPVFSADGRTLAVHVSYGPSAFGDWFDGLLRWAGSRRMARTSRSAVRVFDVASGAELASLPGSPPHQPAVLGFTPDGRTLITQSYVADASQGELTHSVLVWDVPRRYRWLWLGLALVPALALAWRRRTTSGTTAISGKVDGKPA
jgi:WD40 repeat protein